MRQRVHGRWRLCSDRSGAPQARQEAQGERPGPERAEQARQLTPQAAQGHCELWPGRLFPDRNIRRVLSAGGLCSLQAGCGELQAAGDRCHGKAFWCEPGQNTADAMGCAQRRSWTAAHARLCRMCGDGSCRPAGMARNAGRSVAAARAGNRRVRAIGHHERRPHGHEEAAGRGRTGQERDHRLHIRPQRAGLH